jgi:hypothetical protein
MALAGAAFGNALVAAACAAAAAKAVRRLDAEIAVAAGDGALESRWLLWLHDALAALELSLDQAA